jgi:tripartite-type tricarboxylate transporter receptor subunit TctC
MKAHFFATLLALTAGLLPTQAALAQSGDGPDKRIRIVVPFAPGGQSDIFARLIAQKMTELTRQTVIVENRPGAGGAIGAGAVAKSRPDGQTLLLSDVAVYTVAPVLDRKLPYMRSELAPVIQVSRAPQLLITAAGSKLRTFNDALEQIRKAPGSLNIASSGIGASGHLTLVLLNRIAGTSFEHLPYKGGGAALNDVLAGQAEMMFIGTPPAMPLLANGRLRALAVTTASRVPDLPDVPTLAELGVQGFDSTSGQGIFAAGGTPAEVIVRLNGDLARIMALPEVAQRWRELGAEAVSESPEKFKAWLDSEADKWSRVIRDANIRMD